MLKFFRHWKILLPLLGLLVLFLIGTLYKTGFLVFGFKAHRFVSKNETISDKNLADYYKISENLTREQKTKSVVTWLAVGDIMLSRNVAQKIKTANDPLLPFRQLNDLLESVDFSFGNLESPVSGKDTFKSTGSMIFNTPRNNIKGLVENNFKILNLANNHALDQGAAGLEYTIKYLVENNIKHTGAGKTLAEAWEPAIVEQSGIKICFIGASYASINDNGNTTNNYVARIEDLENLQSSIKNLKSNCDFVIASMHAGTEYTHKPNKAQIDFAHAAIDYGADMVIGHHPHWVQTIEKYCPHSSPLPLGEGEGCKYIFYSLGNFIFDQMWSQETREGLALKIQISKIKNQSELQGPKIPTILENIELIPIIIDNYSTPRLANEDEAKKILEKIKIKEKILR